MSSKRPVAPPPPIPGFTYISLLGSGGFSDVYLYEQDRPRRKVAVKVLLSDLKTEGARRRFESEANLMAQLSSHPYIVTIFEAEVTEAGHSYLAMEYCSRPSLDVRYRRQRFSVDEVLAVGIQVASAVETAHRAGIAHRDIKPANILVTDYNRPALTDFGISGTLGGDADEDAGMSIPWSPPEQFTDGPVDGVMVDVWALGATLYTLLAGRSPFVLPGTDNSQRELISRITSAPLPRLGRADVPESLERALSTAMAKPAASRYSSAHAFALALQRIQAELNLSVTPFEVLEESHQDESHPDDGFEETRVRSIAAIDPERTGSAPTFPARTRPQGPGAGSPPSGVPAGPTPPAATARSRAPAAGPGQSVCRSAGRTTSRRQPCRRPAGRQPRRGLGPRHDAPRQRACRRRLRLGTRFNCSAARAASWPDRQQTAQHSAQQAGSRRAGQNPRSTRQSAVRPLCRKRHRKLPRTTANGTCGSPSPAGPCWCWPSSWASCWRRQHRQPKVAETGQVSKPPADALDNGTVPDVADLGGTVDCRQGHVHLDQPAAQVR